jgi:hypothetical protein
MSACHTGTPFELPYIALRFVLCQSEQDFGPADALPQDHSRRTVSGCLQERFIPDIFSRRSDLNGAMSGHGRVFL